MQSTILKPSERFGKYRSKALWASEVCRLFPDYAPPYVGSIIESYSEKTGLGPLRERGGKRIASGHIFEDAIARQFMKENGFVSIVNPNRSKVCEISGVPLGATPDRFLFKERTKRSDFLKLDKLFKSVGLEIKNVAVDEADLWTDDQPAFHVLLQVAVQAMVWQVHKFHIAVCIGGWDTRSYTYERDPKLEKIILAKAKWFWSIVENREWHDGPPEEIKNDVAQEDLKKYISKLYPHKKDLPILADYDDYTAFDEISATDEVIKDAQEHRQKLLNKVALKMKNASAIVDDNGKKLFYKKVTPRHLVKEHWRDESVSIICNKPKMRAKIYE